VEAGISTTTGRADGPELSIVIPAYNEAQRLPLTLRRLNEYLQTQSYDWDITVVSNGSTDATDRVVRDAADWLPNLHLLSIEERGKGIALKVGALSSRGKVLFLCDADLSMPAPEIASFLEALKDADIVAGSREAEGAHRYGEPWHRHLMGRIFNRIVQLMAVPGIDDTQCGFKALRREAADELFSRLTLHGWGYDVELLYLARKYGYRVKELGIDWYFDADTRVRPGTDTLSMLRELLLIRLRDARGRYRRPALAAQGEDRV
jgi:glycosyltransferase involved in cell wall biosynthesis